MKGTSIAILSHANDDFRKGDYFLNLLIPAWERLGFDITVLRGPGRHVPAAAVISHVNLTVVPEAYRACMQHYPVAINGRATDISKRVVSTHRLEYGHPWDGPVIVKTNRNHGGIPDRRLEPARNPLTWAGRKAARFLPWSWTGRLDSYHYPIYDSAREVPRAVWSNPLLVVEKFLHERDGEFYCLRQWLFFGDRESSSLLKSNEPLVKSANVLHRERNIPVPPALHALRARLGFDYGKFDYAVVDGEVVLYDANRTPTSNRSNPSPDTQARAEVLAQGIHALLTPQQVP